MLAYQLPYVLPSWKNNVECTSERLLHLPVKEESKLIVTHSVFCAYICISSQNQGRKETCKHRDHHLKQGGLLYQHFKTGKLYGIGATERLTSDPLLFQMASKSSSSCSLENQSMNEQKLSITFGKMKFQDLSAQM